MKAKRLLSILLVLCMSVFLLADVSFAAENVASGTCGDNLTWTLDSAGTLTISGEGAMWDFYASSPQWKEYSEDIKYVVIANGVTSIGDMAFNDCCVLESVTIGNSTTTIGAYAFGFCESLKSITVPDGLITIGDAAFTECRALTSITIPDGVSTIGNHAFSFCETLTSITIPSSVTTIGGWAFYCCSALEGITVGLENQSYSSLDGVLYNKEQTILLRYPVGKTAASFAIPDSVTTIGDYAFDSCESLANITVPDSVTRVGNFAFFDCRSLTDVYYGGNEEDRYAIGFGYSNEELTNATWHYNHGKEEIEQNKITWSVDKDGILTISGKGSVPALEEAPWQEYGDIITKVVIKEGVTELSDYAFFACSSLISVSLPDGLEKIGNGAFNYCFDLKEISIPNSVTSIGELAFYCCESLEKFTIPNGITSISRAMLGGCLSLTEVVIPNSVTCIGEDAFYACESLVKVKIPNSVTTIESGAFSTCLSLEKITVPDSVTSIGENAFSQCESLKEIKLSNNVKSLSWGMFNSCTSLEKITIPQSVASIGDSAFYGCESLREIILPASVVDIGYAFSWCDELTDVYYGGSEETRGEMNIDSGSGNDALINATWHYNYVPVPDVKLSTSDAAQIRTKGNQGLRFISTIDKTSADFERVEEFGTVLIPSADLSDISELEIGATLNGHEVLAVPAVYLFDETEETITFTAVIIDIAEKNYGRELTARAYAILDDGSVVYADTGTSRSIYMVAKYGLQNPDESEENIAIFQEIVDIVENA